MEKSSIFRHFRAVVVLIAAAAGICATMFAEPPYQSHFDPAKGFTPAQPNFTKIFLQIAGSLEHHGSPEPYIRHVMAEHARIGSLYQHATGKICFSRPSYLTDEYVENLLAGWNKLSEPLKLEAFCRLTGRNMRYAIQGGWNKTTSELVEQESELSDTEKAFYRKLLLKQYFTRSDFPAMEAFYTASYDKLTEEGKEQISTRTQLGQLSPEKRTHALKQQKGGTIIVSIFNQHQADTVAHLESDKARKVNSDALAEALISQLKLNATGFDWSALPSVEREAYKYCQPIKEAFAKRLDFVATESNTPAQACAARTALISMLKNLVVIAHSEFLASQYAQAVK